MELWALMDYIEIYKPRMEGRVPPAKETANVMGCFVHGVHTAERLFSVRKAAAQDNGLSE